jgi:hypothetical protein
MSKYSFEFKKKVVLAYLNGEGGYGYLLKHMEFLLKEILSNGFIIIKPLEMKVYCVLEKIIYILSKKSFLL